MDKNEIKKDLYKSKVFATFAYYDGDAGKLYYNIELFGEPYIFPINTHEKVTLVREYIEPNPDGGLEVEYEKVRVEIKSIKLADDLRGAKFAAQIKGSDLNRWIIKALDSKDLMKLS